jgi:hypothetical protein
MQLFFEYCPQNDVIEGQYSKRAILEGAILEGQYSTIRTPAKMPLKNTRKMTFTFMPFGCAFFTRI